MIPTPLPASRIVEIRERRNSVDAVAWFGLPQTVRLYFEEGTSASQRQAVSVFVAKAADDIGALLADRDSLQAENAALRKALDEITTASEEDCGVPSDEDGEDEPVGATQAEHGPIKGTAMTFGILRRARAALSNHQGEVQS